MLVKGAMEGYATLRKVQEDFGRVFHSVLILRPRRRRSIPQAACVLAGASVLWSLRQDTAAFTAAYAACASFSTTWSMLKLAAFCRGGNSLSVSRNCATSACAGTRTKAWSKIQSQ